MATHVERSIEVEVPVRTVYDQWTQFEEFPRFMSGVQEVRQVGDALTHWVAEIGGVRREWDAAILEQVPDEKVAWAATTGATNAGAVYFQAVGDNRTQVRLTLDYEPEGIVERIADFLAIVERQAVADLDRFKEFIEQRGSATGGWRGQVDEGDVRGGGGAAAGAVAGGAVAGAAAAGGREQAGDVPGDVVAVGPTGGTHGTLDTESGPASTAAYGDDGPGVGHSGDPVAVDAAPAAGSGPGAGWTDTDALGDRDAGGDPLFVEPTPATGLDAARTGGVDTGRGEDPGVGDLDRRTSGAGAATGTETGYVEDPAAVDPTWAGDLASGAERDRGGDPRDVGPGYSEVGSSGPTADAATAAAGVAGFGTDTGLRSDDPSSGAFTGDPGSGTAGRTEGTTTTESWRGSADDATEPARTEESRAGFDDSEDVTAGRGTEGEDEDEVVERDFANRDIEQHNVQRDFANRVITPQDVAHKGVDTGPGGERTSGTSAREGMQGDTGFQGRGPTAHPTDSGDDPTSGAVTGNPDPAGYRRDPMPADESDAGASPTSSAAGGAAGVAGFGTDTGLRSDDPASGSLTGNPAPRTASGGMSEAVTDPAGTRYVEPGVDDRDRFGGAEPDATSTGRDPRNEVGAAGERSTMAAEDETLAGADRRNEPHGLDALDAPGPADGVGADLPPLDPRAGTLDDPDNQQRPGV